MVCTRPGLIFGHCIVNGLKLSLWGPRWWVHLLKAPVQPNTCKYCKAYAEAVKSWELCQWVRMIIVWTSIDSLEYIWQRPHFPRSYDSLLQGGSWSAGISLQREKMTKILRAVCTLFHFPHQRPTWFFHQFSIEWWKSWRFSWTRDVVKHALCTCKLKLNLNSKSPLCEAFG